MAGILVSIPHRYSQNAIVVKCIAKAMVVFQFLIGILKTGLSANNKINVSLFQFLIGILKTCLGI